MSDDNLEGRLRALELRFAYLTGAAVVGLAAALAFMGLTSWETIPSAVDEEVREQISEETLQNIRAAEEKAKTILTASVLQANLSELSERVSKGSLSECRVVASGEAVERASKPCDGGYRLIAGGCAITRGSGAQEDLLQSYPRSDNSWFCQASSGTRRIKAFAVCCPSPALMSGGDK